MPWSASHLERGAVVVVNGAAVVANGGTLLPLVPFDAAMTDLVFLGAVLVLMAVMLIRAGTVQDRPVAAPAGTAPRGLVDRPGHPPGVRRRLGDGDVAPRARRHGAGPHRRRLGQSVNDTHGHPVDDDVLVHLATVLRCGRVRAEDAVLSRLGGDELAVLMPGGSRKTAVHRAQYLLEAVRSTR